MLATSFFACVAAESGGTHADALGSLEAFSRGRLKYGVRLSIAAARADHAMTPLREQAGLIGIPRDASRNCSLADKTKVLNFRRSGLYILAASGAWGSWIVVRVVDSERREF